MVEVKISKDRKFLEVKGHAGFGVIGKDLVCAGVSCIIFGLCNYIDSIKFDDEECIELKNGYCKIDLRELYLDIERIEGIMGLIYVQLDTIKESFKDSIEIEEIDLNE